MRRGAAALCAALPAAAAAPPPPRGGNATAPPAVRWATGFANGACEAHPHAGVQTADGGFLMVGDSVCYGQRNPALKRGIFVVKASAKGAEEWSAKFGDHGYNYGKFAVELRDGTFLVAGSKTVKNTKAKGGYAESRLLVRLDKNGGTIRETVLDNVDPAAGTADGFMCATETVEAGTVIATGYTNGVLGYAEQPMFLLDTGTPFAMKLKVGDGSAAPTIVFDAPVQTSAAQSWEGAQGMRIYEDAANGVYAMSVGVHPKNGGREQFGLATVTEDGSVKWFKMYSAQNKFQQGTMSHPYAFAVAPGGGGYVVAGLGFVLAPLAPDRDNGAPWGRLAKISPVGELEWDTRFRNCDGYTGVGCDEVNTECYGVSVARDGGYAVACGTGCTGKDCGRKGYQHWMAYVARTDGAGKLLWQKDYSDYRQTDNAGEYIITTRDGGYALYIDSNTWGPNNKGCSTGGCFGLMLLEPDA